MALEYRTRRRLAMFLLVVWLPLYVVAAVTIMGMVGRPPLLLELALYVLLGVLWAVPFKAVFKGVGKADPAAALAGEVSESQNAEDTPNKTADT